MQSAQGSLVELERYLLASSSKTTPTFGRVFVVGLFSALVLLLSGCAAVGDVFKAGVWVGVLGVVSLFVVIGGVAALFSK